MGVGRFHEHDDDLSREHARFSAEHLKIFNPLNHPDWVGWARSVLRFATTAQSHPSPCKDTLANYVTGP